MKDNATKEEKKPYGEKWTPLEELIREGARKMLETALEYEVSEFIEKYKDSRKEDGKQAVTRNGHYPERELITGIGSIRIKQPRVDERLIREEPKKSVYNSAILPKYLRKIPSIDNLLPVLYLKGISTNDFSEALASILGHAKGLSPKVIVRLKEKWVNEYNEWRKQDLSNKDYVYIWADGVYFNVRLEEDRSCILVVVGVDREGNKELLAVADGYHESAISWKEVLIDLKSRGLKNAPKLAIGDGALGFWSALREIFPQTREQRCWVHKTVNILDKLPKKIQPGAKELICTMYMSETKKEALKAYNGLSGFDFLRKFSLAKPLFIKKHFHLHLDLIKS